MVPLPDEQHAASARAQAAEERLRAAAASSSRAEAESEASSSRTVGLRPAPTEAAATEAAAKPGVAADTADGGHGVWIANAPEARRFLPRARAAPSSRTALAVGAMAVDDGDLT